MDLARGTADIDFELKEGLFYRILEKYLIWNRRGLSAYFIDERTLKC